MLWTPFKTPNNATPQHKKTLIACCLTCAALLQGCAATSPVSPSASPALPSPPLQSTPAPAQPYSKSWQIEAREWRNAVQKSRDRLMATPLMQP